MTNKAVQDPETPCLAGALTQRGAPDHNRSDTGSEFAVQAVRGRIGREGAETPFFEPGSSCENGCNERSNSKLRDEPLNAGP